MKRTQFQFDVSFLSVERLYYQVMSAHLKNAITFCPSSAILLYLGLAIPFFRP